METEEECPILFEPKQIKVWFQKSQGMPKIEDNCVEYLKFIDCGNFYVENFEIKVDE
ncbi:hypothetical protein CCACVL1_04482, partial [Corchorus capsularis]